jgi:putative selenium metabolism hydrolase
VSPPEVSVDDVAGFALRLIGRQSLSGHEGGVAELVRDQFERLDLDAEVDDWGNVTGTADAGPGPCVLLDAHMDTVGVTDSSEWSHSPWGEVVDRRIYGRGSMDMKGPLAAAAYGAALAARDLTRGRVVVSASVAEELVEGPATVHVAERVEPDFAVICEATSLRLARGQRGRAEIRVEVSGRPTHSSRPDLGVNAAEHMADAIVALRRFRPPAHDALGSGILVLTDVKSEPYPGLSVVPDRCAATFDRRTLPGETERDVLTPLQRLASQALSGSSAKFTLSIAEDHFKTYTGTEIRAPNFAPAWWLEESSALVGLCVGALESAGIEPELSHYSFCTNGSGTAGRLGIPTVGFGPGREEMAHRVDEYIDIDELARAAEGYASIVRRLTEGGKGRAAPAEQ